MHWATVLSPLRPVLEQFKERLHGTTAQHRLRRYGEEQKGNYARAKHFSTKRGTENSPIPHYDPVVQNIPQHFLYQNLVRLAWGAKRQRYSRTTVRG
jgi:hypothetical protein